MTRIYSWISGICADEKENKRLKGKLNCFRYRLQFNSEQNFSEDDLKTIKQTLDYTFINLMTMAQAHKKKIPIEQREYISYYGGETDEN